MGSRNPDRISPDEWRRGCETVGDMYRKRWSLTAVCRTCRLELRVDLVAIVLKMKPDYVLWNRSAKCRKVGCYGTVDFRFKAPGMDGHKPLRAQVGAAPLGHVMRAFEEERERQARGDPKPP